MHEWVFSDIFNKCGDFTLHCLMFFSVCMCVYYPVLDL